jgi:hypothetical protein
LDSSCSTLPELVNRWNERLVQREVSQRLVQGKPACLVPDRHAGWGEMPPRMMSAISRLQLTTSSGVHAPCACAFLSFDLMDRRVEQADGETSCRRQDLLETVVRFAELFDRMRRLRVTLVHWRQIGRTPQIRCVAFSTSAILHWRPHDPSLAERLACAAVQMTRTAGLSNGGSTILTPAGRPAGPMCRKGRTLWGRARRPRSRALRGRRRSCDR